MPERREVVGRHLELEQVEGVLERLPNGLAVAVLTGAAGVGKTTVWRRGVERAHERGFRVLSTRATEAEATLAYLGLSDLVGDVEGERLDLLPNVQRHALEAALLRLEVDGGVDARAVARGVLSVLCDLVTAGPVLIAVDDAQWLDAATAAAIGSALRRLEDLPVGVLATVRTGEHRPRTFLDSLPAESQVVVPLGPLSAVSLHAILRNELGCSLPRPALVRLAAACGGNPFYALEIARQLERLDRPALPETLPVPADVRTLARARLERLRPETRQALLTASCLAVARVGLVDEEALGPAEEAGIVRVAPDGRIEFAHPLLAGAIRESASTARRRAVHCRLAALVTNVEERARHLALAAHAPDAAVADELDAAARVASARGAPEDAAELAELALRMTPGDDPVRTERMLAAAAFRFGTGDLTDAQTLLEQSVAEIPSGPLRARALRLLGLLHSRRSGFAAAVEFALAARDAAAGEAGLTAEIELDLAVYHAWSIDYAGGDGHARAAVPYAEAAGIDGLLANALAVRTMLAFLCGRGVARSDLRRALMLEDPVREAPPLVRPRFVEGFVSLCTGRLDAALTTLDALRAEALEQGRESDAPLLFLYLVWASLWKGDLDRARRYADEARQAADLLDDPLVDALALSASALAQAFAGNADEARRDAMLAIDHFGRLQWWVGTIWPRWAHGFLELSLDNPGDAHEVLQPLTALIAALGPTDISLSLSLPDEVEALLALGRSEDAASLLEPFQQQAAALDRGWALAAAARCRGLIAAARGDHEAALSALEEALRYHRSQSMPLEEARTLLHVGRVQRRRKQKRLARLALEQALAAFETVGAGLWAAQARTELARVATRRAPSGLTATEERIARLAADGLSNRAIGERTFVSVKTVETNLKRAYRKLGISSRAQLARALDEQRARGIS